MSNLTNQLLARLKQKHEKLSKRFLKGIEGGYFQEKSQRRKFRAVEQLKKVERQLKRESRRSGLDIALDMKHWAVALAMGIVVAASAPAAAQTASFTKVQNIGDPTTLQVLVGDIDGDGDDDAIHISAYDNFKLLRVEGGAVVSQSTITKSFAEPVAYADLIDIDGDANLDIITLSPGSPYPVVYGFINDGSGQFTQQPIMLDIPFLPMYDIEDVVVFADIDGDGDTDFINANTGFGDYDIYIYRNNQDFTFTGIPPIGSLSVEKLYGAYRFDSDSDLDIAYYSPGSGVKILSNTDGIGTFEDQTFQYATYSNNPVAFGDLDGDGDADMVVGEILSPGTLYLTPHINDGGFTFSPQATAYATVNGLFQEMSLTDLDGDNNAEIIVTEESYNTSILPNNGAGTFGSEVVLTEEDVIPANLNGDANIDLIVPFPNVSTLIHGGSLAFSPGQSNILTPISAIEADLADMDGDTNLDLILAGNPAVWMNNGNGTFSFGNMSGSQVTQKQVFGNLDADSDVDFVAIPADSYNAGLQIWQNDGNGNIALNSTLDNGTRTYRDVALVDLDGDTDLDIVAIVQGYSYSFYLKSFRNDGGSFTGLVPELLLSQSGQMGLVVGNVDPNVDADADVLITGFSSMTIYTNDGNGSFTQGNQIETAYGFYTYTPKLIDLDGDDILDFTGAPGGESNNTSIFINGGNGNFTEITTQLTVGPGRDVAAADIDGDLDNDLVFTLSEGGNKVFINNGGGSFTEDTFVFEGLDRFAKPVFGDVDSDGDQDLVFSGLNASTKVFLNDLITCNPATLAVDVPALSNLTGECQVAAPTAPTASNDCGDVVTGVSDVTFPVTAQGTTVVTWTFDDGNGNSVIQTQTVIIDDVTAPVANATSLTDVTAECEITALIPATATDNCAGTITGTTNAVLPITAQGTTVVTWTFDDGNGNVSTANQNIVIADVTAPVISTVAPIVNLDRAGNASITAGDLDGGTTDNCGQVTTAIDQSDFTIADLGVADITFTATDAVGNAASAVVSLVVEAHPIYYDSLALVDLYNATNGAGWNDNAGWLSASLDNWAGVTVTNDRVAALDLSANNLDGNVPVTFNDLTAVNVIDLSGNSLSQLDADFSTVSATTINLSDNELDFADFEQIADLSSVVVGTQRSVDVPQEQSVGVGTDATFAFDIDGVNNQYQWYKDGVAITGETGSSLTVSNAVRSDIGIYYAEATNSVITGLTITSATKVLDVTGILDGKISINDTDPATAGEVHLLQVTSTGGYDTTATVSIDNNGNYTMPARTLADYVLVAMVDTLAHPNALPTYYVQTPFWDEAESLPLDGNTTVDLVSLFYSNPQDPVNPGKVSGILEEELGTGGRNEARGRVRGAGVSMRRGRRTGRGEGEGELAYYVYTNNNGEFTIRNVEPGEYNLDIQYPGYPMDASSEINITIGTEANDQVKVIEALVDKGKISVRQLIVLATFGELDQVNVFPNPTSEKLMIQGVTEAEQLHVEVFDKSGSLVLKTTFNLAEGMNVSDLTAGDYIFRFSNDEKEIITSRIVIR